MDIYPAIQILRVKHPTADTAATIEEMAEACHIDVNAPHSYREVLELAESLVVSPYVVRFFVNGERRYFASSYRAEAGDGS